MLVRGLRSGAHPGQIWDTFADAGLRPEVVRTTEAAVDRGRCIITFQGHADAARAVEFSGVLSLDEQALRVSLAGSGPGWRSELDGYSTDEERPPRPETWSEAAARGGLPTAGSCDGQDVRSSVEGRPARPDSPWAVAAARGDLAAATPAAAAGQPGRAGGFGAAGEGQLLRPDLPPLAPTISAAADPSRGAAPGAAPFVPAPDGAGGASPAALAALAAVDLLHDALRPLLLPHTEGRDGITVHRVWGLRFHEEYYGIYVQFAHQGGILEGHVSVLHCGGCRQRLLPAQITRIETRCRGLRGFHVPLAHMEVVLVRHAGHVHRGWCTVHVRTPLSEELWTIRGFLSNWIPRATSRENRNNFHASFDSVAV